jgi:alcohol dehydrogenase (cytochrome c)
MLMRRSLLFGSISVLVALAVLIGTALAVPQLRWRAQVVALKATGALRDITWPRLLNMLKPSSGFWLEPLAKNANLYAAIKNPHIARTDVEAGEVIYSSRCSTCHDADDASGAPDLSQGQYKHGDSDWAIFRVITNGVPGTAMKAWRLSDREVWQLIAYIRSVSEASPPASSAEQPSVIDHSPVTFERIVNARTEPENWLTYSGTYSGQRYSELAQIRRENVRSLRTKWVYQMQTDELHVESSPLVVDGTMFLTAPPGKELAIDAATGRILWSAKRKLPDELSLCCGPHNRGVGIKGHRVFRGTLDAHLTARDSRTGKLLWDVEVGKADSGYSITSAPLVVKDMVVTGVAGGEFGIRGYIDAYDAVSGERIWRTYTVPAPGEPGNETWSGNSWKTGGGPTWMTGSYDPELDLIYWGVGNPSPDFNGDDRKGDNLYTNSVLAIAADTGEIKWFFQFIPHDLHDWDANSVPILLDTVYGGEPRKMLIAHNKGGFGYALDRETGEFISAYEIAEQTWADGVDSGGRPIKKDGIYPSSTGTYVRPSAGGAANWWPSSFNPLTGLVYVPIREGGSIYFKSPTEPEEGEMVLGSVATQPSGGDLYPVVRAFKAGTGERVWEFKMPSRVNWNPIGGTVTTAGYVVFFGDKEFFYGLDAETGRELWKINLGGAIVSAPITYLAGDGKQYIAVVAGRSVYGLAIE